MRFKMKMAAGLAVAAALALSACGGGSAGDGSADGGTTGQALTIAKPDGAITTQSNNPFVGTGSGMTLGYLNAILEPVGMLNLADPSQPAEPWLASQIEWNDDFTAVTLTARDGVTWSDGEPFTVEDLAYAYQMRMDDPALNTSAMPLTGVTIDGDQVTVTFETSMYVRQGQVLHIHVLPKHYIETIDDLTTDPLLDLVGTGPYTMGSFTTQAVTLNARTDWWGGELAVPRLNFVSYNDNTGLVTALANGQVDWVQAWIPNVDSAFLAHDREHNRQWTPAGLGVDAVFVNTTKAPFDNVAFRQAVNMVLDRDAHREIAREGGVPALTSVTGLASPAGDPFVAEQFAGQEYAVDVEGAKAILEAAGYTGVGTALVDPQGNPVTFTISVPQGWSDYVTGASLIVDAVSALGVTATLDTPDADTWWANRSNGNFDAIIHWTDSGTTPFDLYDNTMGARWLAPIGEATDFNFGRFEHPEIGDLLSTYANGSSEEERSAAMAQIQQIFVDEAPAFPIGTRPFIISYNTRNFVGWPDAENPFIVSDFTQPMLPMVLQALRPAS